jgi:molybdate/tungstate transport system permease protein
LAWNLSAADRRNRLSCRRGRSVVLVFWFIGSLLLAFILAPLIGLGTMQSAGDLARVAGLLEVRHAIGLSLLAAFLTTGTAAFLGIPLAYALARTDFPGKEVIAAIVDLPLAVPHTVAGIALLFVFGRQGLIGGPASELLGLRFWGSLAGVVVGMLFVAAPYTVNAARIGFEAVDPHLEKVGRTLGMGPWCVLLHVTLPLAWPSIMTGLTLTYARAISEFAAVAILAYYPMTAPVKIYELFLRFGLDDAAAMSLLLLVVSLGLFILFRHLSRRRDVLPGAGR